MVTLRTHLKLLAQDDRGTTAILFALLAVPSLALIGGAVDFGRAYQARSMLQSAVDAAALAGATLDQGATTQQRISAATSLFNANATGLGITPAVSVDGAKVTVSAHGNVQASFLQLMQIDAIPVGASASATATYADAMSNQKICLLALDPNSTDGIHIQGANTISYPNCWAHTNSTQASAINANGSQATAVGAGHCAVGGYQVDLNNFSPTPKAGCKTVADPFATVGAYGNGIYQPTFTPPTIPSTCKSQNLNLKKGTFTLDPGRYCGGISLQAQATVKFNPGVYIIDNGEFLVQSGSSASASDVMFYFSGANAHLTIIGGGTVSLKGRSASSSYAGMLFIAHPDAWRGNSSNIQGGGTLNLEGVLYMPTQRIEVAGNGDVNGSTTYFGMIAKDFYFRGNGSFKLHVQDGTSTLPDKLPVMPGDPQIAAVKLQ